MKIPISSQRNFLLESLNKLKEKTWEKKRSRGYFLSSYLVVLGANIKMQMVMSGIMFFCPVYLHINFQLSVLAF